ncbi:MAG TPA: DUF1707 domain-containing protein [Gemmatimonadales bacterium]
MPAPLTPAHDPSNAVPSAARERMVQLLTQHYANDDLTDAELEARLDRVYAATALSQLDAIVADLPALPGSETRAVRAAPAPDTHITAVFSGQERSLTGVVPRELKLRARLGYVELDLRQATFEPGVTVIDARAFLGFVQIRLPPGVRVESVGRSLFGLFSRKAAADAAGAAGGGSSVVRITGRAVFGFVES